MLPCIKVNTDTNGHGESILVVKLNSGFYTGQELNQTEEEELMSWESFMKENYLASVKQDNSQSSEYRIEDTAEK